jgi:hypothetical protein
MAKTIDRLIINSPTRIRKNTGSKGPLVNEVHAITLIIKKGQTFICVIRGHCDPA